jgi:hypothetical protein
MNRFLSVDQIYSGESILRTLVSNVTTNLTSNNTIISKENEQSGMSWSNLLLVILMILLSAYCNGTNIGVMGLDVQ